METTQEPEAGRAEQRTAAELFEAAVGLALDPELPPDERAARITALLKAVDSAQKQLTETRRADVLTMRQNKTLAVVAERIGLSVPRVDQIAKGK